MIRPRIFHQPYDRLLSICCGKLKYPRCHSGFISETIYINPESSSGSETLKRVQGDNIVS
jgi:hypothetical protein